MSSAENETAKLRLEILHQSIAHIEATELIDLSSEQTIRLTTFAPAEKNIKGIAPPCFTFDHPARHAIFSSRFSLLAGIVAHLTLKDT
jgi:hypothetical protein